MKFFPTKFDLFNLKSVDPKIFIYTSIENKYLQFHDINYNLESENFSFEDINIKLNTIEYFTNQNKFGWEDLCEDALKKDFDLRDKENVENSMFSFKYKKKLFVKKLNKSIKKLLSKYLEDNKKEEDENEKKKVDPELEHFFFFLKFEIDDKVVWNRKNSMMARPGVSKNPKKNSLMRNKNLNIINQIISIFTKKGKKKTAFKHHNIMNEEFYDFFEFDNINKYKNYNLFKKLLEENPKEYHDFNKILSNHLPIFNSLFDIKSKKNKRIKRRPDIQKYSLEIVYVKKDKRVRNTLKVFEMYNENFKSYDFWERLLLMYLTVILDWHDSFLIKRRLFIYEKSIKFFRAGSQKKNYG